MSKRSGSFEHPDGTTSSFAFVVDDATGEVTDVEIQNGGKKSLRLIFDTKIIEANTKEVRTDPIPAKDRPILSDVEITKPDGQRRTVKQVSYRVETF